MRTLLIVALLAAACSGPGDRAGDHRAQGAAAEPAIAAVSVDELDRLLAGGDCQAVDANGEDTRRRMGVIPGALRLGDGDPVAQLPADRARHLVFYCANEACRASHEAAERAITAGYTRVEVLPAGIAGWVKAGKRVEL